MTAPKSTSPATVAPHDRLLKRLDQSSAHSDYPETFGSSWEGLCKDAARAIRHLTRASQPATPTGGETIDDVPSCGQENDYRRATAAGGGATAWCGWHPDRGMNFGTMAETQQGATSRLMMTGLAGNHGWSVIPLYAIPQPAQCSAEIATPQASAASDKPAATSVEAVTASSGGHEGRKPAAHIATLVKQYAFDLRRNASGGDDYPFDFAKSVADYLEILVKRAKGDCSCAQAGFPDSCDNCDGLAAPEAPCPKCQGSGFSGRGSGYDDVCDECGGLRYFPAPAQSPQGIEGFWHRTAVTLQEENKRLRDAAQPALEPCDQCPEPMAGPHHPECYRFFEAPAERWEVGKNGWDASDEMTREDI